MAFALATITWTSALATLMVVIVDRILAWLAQKRNLRSGALGALFVAGTLLFVGGHWYLQRKYSWLPTFTITEIDIKGDRYPYLPVAISDNGRIVAIGETPLRRTVKQTGWVRLWDVESGKEITPADFSVPYASSLCLSPDGKLLAVVHRAVSVYDTTTGRLVKRLNVAPGHPWASRPCRFSPDGNLLVLCSADLHEDYRVAVWETADWTLKKEGKLSKPAQPAIADGRLVLLGGTASQQVELFDLLTLQSLHAPQFRLVPGVPVLSPDGERIACGNYLADLATGETQNLAAPVYCFANNGKWFATRRCDMTSYRDTGGSWGWRGAMPFLRHWYKYAAGQAVLLDVTTGEEIAASPISRRDGENEFHASADGKTILGASGWGRFRVWRINSESPQ